MRTTIDIPDETYREVKTMAAQESTTVRQLVLDGLELVKQKKSSRKKRRFQVPLIPATGDRIINPTEEELLEASIPS
jgi:hypothetical protein